MRLLTIKILGFSSIFFIVSCATTTSTNSKIQEEKKKEKEEKTKDFKWLLDLTKSTIWEDKIENVVFNDKLGFSFRCS